MKILEINKFYFRKGGADIYFLDLIHLLEAKGHQIAVFSMDHPENEDSPWKKYFVSTVGYASEYPLSQRIRGIFRMFYSFKAKRKITKLLDEFRPDVVHVHNIYHQISPSILGEIKKRGIPILMTVHDYKLICPDYLLGGGDWKSPTLKTYLNFIRNKSFKNSFIKSFLVATEFAFHRSMKFYEKNIDLYLVPSEFVKNMLAKHGISGEKIITLPLFSGKTEVEKYSEKNIPEKFVLAYGRISKQKNFDRLVSYFENFPIPLYLAGALEDGLEIPEGGNVRYLGKLSRKELNRYLKNCLFTISPSSLSETFGLVALESLAHGKPFVGLNNGAYGEIVENWKEGFICRDFEELFEKSKLLSEDENLRKKFSANALKKAQNFSEDKHYEELVSLMEKVNLNSNQGGKHLSILISNKYFYISGLFALVLNWIRREFFGLQNPRPFSGSDYQKSVQYDWLVVENMQERLASFLGSKFEFKDKSVLEIGPGPDLGTGVILIAQGAQSYTAIDRFRPMKMRNGFYAQLKLFLKKMGFSDLKIIDQLQGRKNSQIKFDNFKYLNVPAEKIERLGKEYDVVFSQAALEHVEDVKKVFAGMHKVMNSGGLGIHEIDFQTHTGFLRDRDPLNILRYGKIYDWLKFSGAPNRLRASDFMAIAKRAGFSKVELIALNKFPTGHLLKTKKYLAKNFRNYSNDDLETLSAFLIVQK